MINIAFILIGFLVIVFRKQFARFIMWYHTKNRHLPNSIVSKLDNCPKKVFSAANSFSEKLILLIGILFIIVGILSLIKACRNREQEIVNIIYHSEALAAERVVEFVDICLTKQDFVGSVR